MVNQRQQLYRQISEKRGRPFLAYVTSLRQNIEAIMATDVVPSFIEHVDHIVENNGFDPKNCIDVMIISNGGDPLVSWRLISILREKFSRITAIIPYTAYSAATLFALGADDIIMHPYSNLGPSDIQISMALPNGMTRTLSFEDISKYFEFVKDIGITDQALLEKTFDKLTTELTPTAIGFSKRGSQLSLTMCEKLLRTHMPDQNKARLISETLNTKYYSHGYPLSREEAKSIGLDIAESDSQLERLIWNVYKCFAKEFKFDSPLNPQQIVLEAIEKRQNQSDNQINKISEVTKIASIESIGLESSFKNETIIYYNILQDGNLQYNLQTNNLLWKTDRIKTDE